MSTEEIKKVNSGIAIESVHFLNDGLWQLKEIKKKWNENEKKLGKIIFII